MHIRTTERALTLSELFAASPAGTLREAFCVGTTAVIIPTARIRCQRPRPGASAGTEVEAVEVVLPPGRVGQEALRRRSGIASWIFRRHASSVWVGRFEPLMHDAHRHDSYNYTNPTKGLVMIGLGPRILREELGWPSRTVHCKSVPGR